MCAASSCPSPGKMSSGGALACGAGIVVDLARSGEAASTTRAVAAAAGPVASAAAVAERGAPARTAACVAR
eukprot:15450920-Alexandrium_andersonii.AAC.1